MVARRIIHAWYSLRVALFNYAKPLSWWVHVDQPHPRTTTPNTIDIRGWAFNPLAKIVSIEVFIDGKRYGKLSLGESRPDVYKRFRMPNSQSSGFSGRIRYETTLNRNITVVLRITDDINETTEHPVQVMVSAALQEYVDTDAVPSLPEPYIVDELRKIIEHYRLRFLSDPIIADWDTGLHLQQVFPELRIVKPLDVTFPYINRELDVVIVGAPHIRNVENAKYAAKNLLVGVVANAAGGRTEFKAQWLNASEYNDTVSVVITAGDNVDLNMLRDLLVMMQSELIVEIIILHDVKLIIEPLMRTDARIKEVFTSPETSLTINRNRAGLSALGEIVVFLNATEIPQAGWLAPLLRTFANYPECGAVFGKILATDGRLYEAGGVVFANGVYYSYGYSDVDIDASRYQYSREIDAGRLGLMATRRNLFASLRGFDTEYAPDGYEIIDFCFRLRDEEKQVIYQPNSVIRQLFTPRPEPESDQTIFYENWKDHLVGHVRSPITFDTFDLYKLTAKNITSREALICLSAIPACTLSIEYRRIWQVIRVLHNQNFIVRLLVKDTPDPQNLQHPFIEAGVPVYTLAGEQLPLNVDQFLRAHAFELVVCFSWQTASQFIPQIRESLPSTPVIVEALEVGFIRSQQKQSAPLDAAYGQAMVEEMNIYRQADRVVLVSESDFQMLNGLNPLHHNLAYVPIVDDLPVSKLAFGQRAGILLIGDFRQEADRQSLDFFVKKVLPKIDPLLLAANPVYVVGCGLDTFAYPQSPHVRYTGWIPTALPYLERSRVLVAPALQPHSMGLSIIQAMLVGTPVVSTSVAARDFDLRDDENVLLGDDAEAFAEHISHLLDNDALWIRIAAFGYEHMLNYRSVKILNEMYAELLQNSQVRR